MVKATIRKDRPVARRTTCPPEQLARVRDWIEREISFINSPEFGQPDFAARLQVDRPASLDTPLPAAQAEPGMAFVCGFVEAPLLSPEEETYLFTRMNFLRYRAEQSRQRLTLNRPDTSLMDRIDADLAEAVEVRNRIVRSNLRLVVSMARKLSPSLDQMSELIGEATVPLIRAVELYNVGLGNRFSTYATWAIRNHMLRCLKRRQSVVDRTAAGDGLWLEQLADERSTPEDLELHSNQQVAAVQQLLASLSDRERLVITARFGLDGQPSGQSLQDIADRVGLSKERVRQIAIHAIAKLQSVAKMTEISPA